MKNFRRLIIVAVVLLLMVSNSFATTCNTSCFTLDWVSLTPDFVSPVPPPYDSYPAGNLLGPGNSYNATKCVGIFPGGNDDGGLSNPSPNIGHLGDGLLNGQLVDGVVIGGDSEDIDTMMDPTFTQSGDSEPNYFTCMEFIVDDDLQNLGYVE